MISRCTLIAFLLIAPRAFSQADSNLPRLGRNMEPGRKVAVRLADGRELRGSVLRISPAELSLKVKDRTETIPTARIEEVTGRRKDSIWNGLIAGSAVGALLGWAAVASNDCDSNECGEAAIVPGGIVLGAGVGLGIDLLRRKKEVLYTRSPGKSALKFNLMLGQAKGAKVSWRF